MLYAMPYAPCDFCMGENDGENLSNGFRHGSGEEWISRASDYRSFMPQDVLIRVKAAAICGSDLHIFKGRHPSAPLPVAIGHELSGEVLSTGGKVSRVKEGDRVVIEPVIVCGRCHFCRRGTILPCAET